VLHALGAGGMGLVCAAHDAELDRKVAIKLLRPHRHDPGRSNSLGQARLLREAQAMARVSHPNVVAVHEVGTFGDQVFIAMEFVAGVTLKQWLRRARRPWREVVSVFLQAGRGLAAAHAAGLIHRDFKPDNVMISEDRSGRVERVRVFDFGVVQETREAAQRQGGLRTPHPEARLPRLTPAEGVDPQSPRPGVRTQVRFTPPEVTPEPQAQRSGEFEAGPLRRARARSLPPSERPMVDSQESPPSAPDTPSLSGEDLYSTGLTAAGALVGTPMYMAPEQYDQAADARSDQFSFCAALYEALYRRRPFGGDAGKLQQAKRAGAIRPPPRSHGVPAWLHRVVVRGLAADPARRYPGMEALLTALERDRGRGPTLALAALSAALFLFALGAALAWSLGGDGDPCDEAGARASMWGAAHRERVHDAFLQSGRPYAESTWAAVDAALGAYARQWAHQRTGVCLAARDPLPGPQLPARGACLDHRRHEFGALVDQLARADPEVVDHATQAAAQLRPVAACADIEALIARSPPPPPAGAEAEARALGQRLAEVRALEGTGRYAAGLDVAGAAVRDARMLGQPPLLAEALYWQGLLRSRLTASRLGEAELREALFAAEESRHDELVAQAATELVRVVGVEQERHAEGALLAELAGAALRRVGDDAGEVVRLGYLGHLGEARDDLPAAHAAFTRALELARRTYPEGHPQVATALDDLAGMQLRRGEFAAAEAGYQTVLKIRRDAQGDGHPRVAEALGHLGRAAAAQGQHERARELYAQALAICDRHHVCGPAGRAEALLGLGRAEAAAGRFIPARAYHEEALALYEQTYGGEHARVAGLLVDVGVYARRQGDLAGAASYFQRALAIHEQLYEPDHPAMAPVHVHLGSLALALGELDDARVEFERALEIHEKNDGFEDTGLAALHDDLGVVAERQRRVRDAVHHYDLARQVYRRTLDEGHPDVVRATNHLAAARLAADDPAAAEAVLEPSLLAQEPQQPPPSALPDTRFLLAQALVARSRGPDAPARRGRARQLASTALAALRADPTRAADATTVEAWLRALGRP
jgi:serine/threonine protein kinase/Tfp pilus assembly protein PilF